MGSSCSFGSDCLIWVNLQSVFEIRIFIWGYENDEVISTKERSTKEVINNFVVTHLMKTIKQFLFLRLFLIHSPKGLYFAFKIGEEKVCESANLLLSGISSESSGISS